MARPQRNNVDYFPFICEDGKKMFYIEETYGNDGFAVVVKILRELAKVDYHYLHLSNKADTMFLSAKCKVSSNVLESILNDLSDLGKIDEQLWKENNIVWCQDFIDSIQDAYSKRLNNCIDRKSLLALLESKGIRKPSKSIRKPIKKTLKGGENPQSIEEDSIEDEIEDEKEKLYKSLSKKFYENLKSSGLLSIKKDPTIKSWTKEFKGLIESDGITEEQIRNALNFYFERYEDEFCPVIKSPKSLREKFEKLRDHKKRYDAKSNH